MKSLNIVIDPEFKACIPPLKPEEFAQLEANIVRDGKCHDPLLLWKGILIDGHNRYEICTKHGIDFVTAEIDCGATRDHALAWMGEHQLGRRNISDDVRAVLAKHLTHHRTVIAMAERGRTARAEVKERNPVKSDLLETSSNKSLDSLPKPKRDGTRKTVAKEKNISEWKLRTSQEIDKKTKGTSDGAAIDKLIIAGTISLNDGKKLAALPEATRSIAIESVGGGADVRVSVRAAKKDDYNAKVEAAQPRALEGKYRIFYIDPPWKYHGLNQADEYGHAERHYDCLDDNQLKDFKPDGERLIKDLAEENAVLFMWVTSPMLKRSFPIMEAWGFDYKSSFIWDKVKHVMGFYSSVRHEQLLIGTKGACKPDVPKLFDSVQSIERSDKHSEKPHAFYNIIESLYDHGRKLEIFSRQARPGWDSAGNESAPAPLALAA